MYIQQQQLNNLVMIILPDRQFILQFEQLLRCSYRLMTSQVDSLDELALHYTNSTFELINY